MKSLNNGDVPDFIATRIPILAHRAAEQNKRNRDCGSVQNYAFVGDVFEAAVHAWQSGEHALFCDILTAVEEAVEIGDKEVADMFCIEFVQAVRDGSEYYDAFVSRFGPNSKVCHELLGEQRPMN